MADGVVDSRAAPNRWRSRVRDGAATSASIPPASAAGHFVVGPSVATEAAALEDDLSPAWWTHRPASGTAIGEPFEHDSRTASGAGGRPAGGSPGVRPPPRGSCPDDDSRPGANSPMRLPFAVDSLACARVAIMLIPSYTAAALTGEMVWTIPTLAGASALAASLKGPEDPTRAVDELDTDDASSEDDPDGGGDTE